MTNSIEEIAGADFILAIGTNTTETHPIISLKVRKALSRGAKLVVMDPRKTEMAQMAHIHIQHRPGSDLALLNAMAQVIVANKLWDRDYVASRTEGFEEFCEVIKKYTPEAVQEVTGVEPELVRQVAKEYARTEKATILYTMGVTQHICGTDNVLAIANLAMLTGHVGKENAGVNPLRGQNNVQGACDMGALPNVLTAYQPVTNAAVRGRFEEAWGVKLPDKPGLTVGEMMDAAYEGRVKAMYIVGENPVISDPNSNHVKEALSRLEFLVVQDLFLTETARFAQVVFPAASFAEKDGTFTNTERRVQRVRKAIEPVGNSWPDWQIVCALATAMGYPMSYPHPAAIMEEIASLTPSYGGITYERLDQGSLQWPCPHLGHPGTKVLHQQGFARGLGLFVPVEYVPPDEEPDAEYPLVLTTGRRLFHYHTGTMSRRVEGLEKILPEERLEVNPADAGRLGIGDGERVRVISRRGRIEVAVQVTDRVPPQTVFGTFHFFEAPINELTNDARDPKAKIPELKVCAVRLEKIS